MFDIQFTKPVSTVFIIDLEKDFFFNLVSTFRLLHDFSGSLCT